MDDEQTYSVIIDMSNSWVVFAAAIVFFFIGWFNGAIDERDRAVDACEIAGVYVTENWDMKCERRVSGK